jgi:hypothetical protein
LICGPRKDFCLWRAPLIFVKFSGGSINKRRRRWENRCRCILNDWRLDARIILELCILSQVSHKTYCLKLCLYEKWCSSRDWFVHTWTNTRLWWCANDVRFGVKFQQIVALSIAGFGVQKVLDWGTGTLCRH